MIFDQQRGLEYVPLGMVHDRVEAAFLARPEPEKIQQFCEQNRIGIKEWMALGNKGEWVDLRQRYVDPAVKALAEHKQQGESSGNG